MTTFETTTPRAHTYTDEEFEAARAPWPSWPHVETPRAFDRDAVRESIIRLTQAFYALDSHFYHSLSERDGEVGREEALFWLSVMTTDGVFRREGTPEEQLVMLRTSPDALGVDATTDEVLERARTCEMFRERRSVYIPKWIARMLRWLVPWEDAFELLLENDSWDDDTILSALRNLGPGPIEQREWIRETLLRWLEEKRPDLLAQTWRLDTLLASFPLTSLCEGRAARFDDGDEVTNSWGVLGALMRVCPEQTCLDLIERLDTEFDAHSIRVVFARFGHGVMTTLLEKGLTPSKRYPKVDVLTELDRIHSPEVVAGTYAFAARGGERAHWAEDYLDGAPVEHVAIGLLELCRRAGKKRTWATERLRALSERDGGPEAIEGALGAHSKKLQAFVRAQVLTHEEAVDTIAEADVPPWAKAIVSVGANFEAPAWMSRTDVPPLIVEGDGRALPNTASLGYLAFVLRELDSSEGIEDRVTDTSLAELALDCLRQWYTSDMGYTRDLELAKPLDLARRHPSVKSIALIDEYLHSKTPPNRGREAANVLDHAVHALGGIEMPEAYAALARLSDKGRRESFKTIASSCIGQHCARLGMSRREFVDVSVPTYELDARGGRDFDYGARTIRMQIEGGALVFVDTSKGKTTTRPPKALKSDDHDLATRALETLSVVTKTIKVELQAQRIRLERELIVQGGWNVRHWSERIVAHPLLGPMARGLVWSVCKEGETVAHLRPTEDGGFIDAEMNDVELPGVATMKPTHPIDLDPEHRRAWADHLLEFEIVQPIDQIGREVLLLEQEHTRALIEALLAGDLLIDTKSLRTFTRNSCLEFKPEKYSNQWRRSRILLPYSWPDTEVMLRDRTDGFYGFGAITHDRGSTDTEFASANHAINFAEIAPRALSEIMRVLERVSVPAPG